MAKGARFAIAGLWVAMMATVLLTGSARASGQPDVTLEQAIQVVRQNFDIPGEYTEFQSSLNQYEGGQSWYLAWERPGGPGGSFSAQVDAVSGEITSMHRWKPSIDGVSRIPAVSWEEARQTAARLLQRLIPGRMDSLVMIEEQEPRLLDSSGAATYTVNWRRVANRVPLEGAAAWVNLDAADGEVLSYDLNWNRLPLPDPQGVIGPEAAQHGFLQSDIIKLEYQLPEQAWPRTGGAASGPMLAYVIDHPSNGAIDAFTGQPFIPAWEGGMVGGKDMGAGGGFQPQAGPAALTPEEQKEVERLSGLISREEAAAIILEGAAVRDEMVLRSASLEKDWLHPDVRIWSLNWSTSAADGKPSQYLYGRVDARSGELLSFNLGLPQGEQPGPGLSQAEGRRLAEDLLRRLQGARFAQFQLDTAAMERFRDSALPISDWPTWNLRFTRIQDGIPFPANGADISIDRALGRVTSYALNWDHATLPAAAGVIGLEQAKGMYLDQAPLTLTYAAYYSAAKRDTEMRLVYLPKVPDGQPGFRMLDAFSGEPLDNKGKPLASAPARFMFNDVAGNFAEKEINMLGRAGLMTEYGGDFRPAEAVQAADLLRAMLSIYQGADAVRELSRDEVMKRALAQGWLKHEMEAQSAVTREFMAQLMVRSLGLEYLAKLPDIYRLPYRDAASISPGNTGHVALCWGLGIIRADGVRFAPRHEISRAEAAAALVNSLRVKR